MSHLRGIFITGTDTGVGKTYVGAGIAAALRASDVDVGVMKPVETGCALRKGKLVPSDALHLASAAGAEDPLDLVNPYRFRRPLAPSVAAALDRRRISIGRISRSFRELIRRHDFLIVEGAGGIMVPLSGTYLYLDLASELKLPVLIVARPGLGTINHTLLTVSALRRAKALISGIVIDYGRNEKQGPAERSNPQVIARLSGVPVLGIIRYGQKDLRALSQRILRDDR
jgi:dethiobiotin synthetase